MGPLERRVEELREVARKRAHFDVDGDDVKLLAAVGCNGCWRVARAQAPTDEDLVQQLKIVTIGWKIGEKLGDPDYCMWCVIKGRDRRAPFTGNA